MISSSFIGVLGIVVGALLHAVFARQNETERHLTELRNQAYADFLNSASQIAVAQRNGQRSSVTQQLAQLADAKARICVYGDAVVVSKLAGFLRCGGTLQTEQEILSFTQLCLELRASVGMNKKQIMSEDISQLLFSVDVANVETPKKKKS